MCIFKLLSNPSARAEYDDFMKENEKEFSQRSGFNRFYGKPRNVSPEEMDKYFNSKFASEKLVGILTTAIVIFFLIELVVALFRGPGYSKNVVTDDGFHFDGYRSFYQKPPSISYSKTLRDYEQDVQYRKKMEEEYNDMIKRHRNEKEQYENIDDD